MTIQTENQSAPKNSGFVRRMIDSHSILGLSFAALIYIVSLTGALTLFVDEISLWESPGTLSATHATMDAVNHAAQQAQAQAEDNYEILNVIAYAPDEFRPYLTVRLNQRETRNAPLESIDWLANPQTGELLQTVDAPFAHLIEELHTELLLPRPWGRYLVGLIGVAMFTLILSGIFAHPTIVKDAFKLRLQRNARMAWTDIHNRLSVWALPFHLVITFTGAFLGIAGITVAALAMLAFDGDQEAAIQVIQGPQPILEAPELSAPPNYADMLASSSADDRRFSLLVASNPRSSGYTTSVAYYEEGILSMRTSDVYRNTGEYLEKFGGRGSPAGARAFGMVQPLHYGTFGGYTVKFIYFVLSLALTYITSTGMLIWFSRKRQQGQAKVKTEALWRGMTSGLSLALALTAVLASVEANHLLFPTLLVTWIVGLLLTLLPGRLLLMVRVQYFATAALLALAACLQFPVAMGAGAPAFTILMTINALLVSTAAAFVWAARRL